MQFSKSNISGLGEHLWLDDTFVLRMRPGLPKCISKQTALTLPLLNCDSNLESNGS